MAVSRKEAFQRAISHLTHQRAEAKELLAEFESGQHQWGSVVDGKQVDESAEMISILRREIETCDKWIPAYEQRLKDL